MGGGKWNSRSGFKSNKVNLLLLIKPSVRLRSIIYFVELSSGLIGALGLRKGNRFDFEKCESGRVN